MSILLVALAVGLRLAWVLLVPTRPVGDFALYLESAAHLLAHGALDDEFIYMPGYVFLVAGVQALGGGLLAAKVIGVASGGLGTWAVFHIAQRLWGRGPAVVAGLLAAAWPAGIAVASVTGTDMPAAALLATAVAVLLRDEGRGRPRRAVIGFGVWLGLAAYVRAVAVPLALLALPYWIAVAPRPGRAALRTAVARTALGCGVALLLLLPWGIRNRVRYGETFVTDSHGGHTALVGANPNSEGVYSRSLNQMFWKGTGFRLFDPSPRDADRAAYALAKSWAAFEPAYAVGLVAAKADRLLTHERNLLYWPLYRESVLRDPPRAFFDRHRAGVERLVDWFWYLLAGAAVAGVALAVAERRWRALAIVPIPLALVALYATFFSEVRYHLAIAIFMFPFAAAALVWLVASVRDLARGARGSAASPSPDALALGAPGVTPARRTAGRALAIAALSFFPALLFLGWHLMLRAGEHLRARHRWAVCVCTVDGKGRLCNWRALPTGAALERSPVRGVWNGVGLRVADPDGAGVAAAAELPVIPGRYHVTARADRLPAGARPLTLGVEADGQSLASLDWQRGAAPPATTGGSLAAAAPDADIRLIDGTVTHAGGPLRIVLRAAGADREAGADAATVWVSDIRVEPDPR